MKWQKVALRDVSLGIYDGPHATPPECEKSGQYFLGIPHLSKDGRIDLSSPRYIADEDYPRWIKRVKPAYGDVIFSYEATLNLYALIPRGVECCLGRRMGLVRPDAEKLDFRYLYYYFFSDEWRKLIAAKTIVGATVDRLSIQDFPTYPISLPPLPVQRKIAEILGAYDDLIENNLRRIALLEKMARELYRERFVRRKGKGSEVTLLEVFDFVRGKSYASNEIDVSEGVPMVNLKNIRAWGGYNAGAERLFSGDYKEEQTLGRGDVIMGVTDMTQDRRIVGHVALVPTLDQAATFSMDIIKLIPKGMSNVELYSILQYSGVSKEISQLATGATVLHLRPSSLDSVRLWVPRKADFEKVEELFSGYYSEIDNLVLQNRNLARQRDRLLPRLMSGRLEVRE